MTVCWTHNGLIDLTDIPTSTLSAEGVANALAKVNRFAGQTADPWSVAEHSYVVAMLCTAPDEAAWALLHDAHEMFIGEVTQPGRDLIESQSQPVGAQIVKNCFREAQTKIDQQIKRAWRVNAILDLKEVEHNDHVALLAEMFLFFGRQPEAEFRDDVNRALTIIREMPKGDWKVARNTWLSKVEKLSKVGAFQPPQMFSESL